MNGSKWIGVGAGEASVGVIGKEVGRLSREPRRASARVFKYPGMC